ncbi:MAG: FHIPEP family type III secretion protein [Planctomycetes bacterium]|nr:FHIPEP family type III secretion protein [Planctomycetota bacterium]
MDKQMETKKPEKVEGLLPIDPVEVEVGYALIKLVDPAQGGVVLDKITRLRRQIATELGVVVPPIRVRDNLSLDHNIYTVKIRGIKIAQSQLMPDMILAINPGATKKKIPGGIQTKDPTFGLEAYWIDPVQKDFADEEGYTTVDPPTALATHLSELLKKHATELLTREEVSNLIKTLKETHPSMVDELIGATKPVDTGLLQKVLKNLLREEISIRDLGLVVETIANVAQRVKNDVEIVTEYVRQSLARQITEKYRSDDGKIYAVTLEPQIEDLIKSATHHTEQGSIVSLPPATAKKLAETITRIIKESKNKFPSTVILVQPQIRPQVKKVTEAMSGTIPVLSYNELMSDVVVEITGSIQSD